MKFVFKEGASCSHPLSPLPHSYSSAVIGHEIKTCGIFRRIHGSTSLFPSPERTLFFFLLSLGERRTCVSYPPLSFPLSFSSPHSPSCFLWGGFSPSLRTRHFAMTDYDPPPPLCFPPSGQRWLYARAPSPPLSLGFLGAQKQKRIESSPFLSPPISTRCKNVSANGPLPLFLPFPPLRYRSFFSPSPPPPANSCRSRVRKITPFPSPRMLFFPPFPFQNRSTRGGGSGSVTA